MAEPEQDRCVWYSRLCQYVLLRLVMLPGDSQNPPEEVLVVSVESAWSMFPCCTAVD